MVPKNSTFTSHDIASYRTSSQLSVDIFMASGDQKQPQKSLAEQKILQKGVNPWQPPPWLAERVISRKEVKSIITIHGFTNF